LESELLDERSVKPVHCRSKIKKGSTMIRCSALSLAAIALSALPASAATYIGRLNGVITSGKEDYNVAFGENPVPPYTKDLTNDPIFIDFTATVVNNYTDKFGNLVPKYISTTISVTIPSVSMYVQTLGATYSNVQYDFFHPVANELDFVGDAVDGHLTVSGYRGPSPHVPQALDFSYVGASPSHAPLTGSGTSVAGLDGAYGFDFYNVAFRLTDGFVQSATPEPESWALMILGFGAIGGAMRRERYRIALKFKAA
jgi:hypothetical protein